MFETAFRFLFKYRPLVFEQGDFVVGVSRPMLNIGTMLCSIADVYDAMRTERRYQQAFPTDRILQVLKAKDGRQFVTGSQDGAVRGIEPQQD